MSSPLPKPDTAPLALPGIMPDHWIREKALSHGMIEPFAEKQNREVNGEKIISMGSRPTAMTRAARTNL